MTIADSASRSAEGREHLAGLGRVEDGEVDASGAGDDLGCERRSAHAAEHDVGDAVGLELLAEGLDLGDQRAGHGHGLGPAEALRRLVLGGRTPQLGVLGGDAARDEVGHEARGRCGGPRRRPRR